MALSETCDFVPVAAVPVTGWRYGPVRSVGHRSKPSLLELRQAHHPAVPGASPRPALGRDGCPAGSLPLGLCATEPCCPAPLPSFGRKGQKEKEKQTV